MGWLKKLAERMGVYNRIRFSWPYLALLRFKNPKYFAALQRDAEFYGSVFGKQLGRAPKLIFDVGANSGSKAWAFRQSGARVICFEPDPYSIATLRARFAMDPLVQIEPVALGKVAAQADFFAYEAGSAYNTLSNKQNQLEASAKQVISVSVATLDQMLAKHGRPDFLKVDVEGFELPVFEGRSSAIPLVSFEANLPQFLQETLAVIDLILARDPLVRFNAIPAEGHQMLFDDFVPADQIRALVHSINPGCLDVFARSTGS